MLSTASLPHRPARFNFFKVLSYLTHTLTRRYAREAEIESEIIKSLQRTLPPDVRFPIVRLHRTFESRGHYCLAFDKMGPSLYHALKLVRSRAEPPGAAAAAAGNDGNSGNGGGGSGAAPPP